ncbi:PREDICTED: uncharacterized mitochondrial protein AtMg00860-like [Theobroma cacao]|uniref:Uncharacterized mitochondrial protein AtMg00860-like n=1 Tax=Theobroma cacao TaxID=3641 RepID=A0AB32W0E1_THECC|nr:PREDICTED: uncharacterized mitochondrial protein AtMg00860-like [Theobroma cacao]
MSPPKLVELKKRLGELFDVGFIQPPKSLYGALVLFQRKHDGTLCSCIDYRALNKLVIKNKYPIPLIIGLFDQLGGPKWFTKLDLQSGYYQMLEEHVQHIRLVMEKLREHELYNKKEKCSFGMQEIPFLGHIIGGGNIRMDLNKVKSILEWEPPTKVTKLRSFLGLANYYKRFVKGYSAITTPLTDMLKKGMTRKWSTRSPQAFDTLKQAMCTVQILALPDHTKSY